MDIKKHPRQKGETEGKRIHETHARASLLMPYCTFGVIINGNRRFEA